MPLHIKSKLILKATLFCVVFTLILIIFSFFKSFLPDNFERLAHGILGTIAAILSTIIFIKLDKITFAEVGLKYEKDTLKKFFSGILLGIVIMGLCVSNVIYFSDLEMNMNSNSNILNFLICTLPLIPLAFMEEVVFRAYPLSILKEKYGVRNSVYFSSLLFALYHIANGWTIQNSFLGAGVWGIIYGITAIYSNGIAMPTGLHFAANLTTSAFGITDNSFNIWTLKQNNGDSLENFQSSELMTWIPQIALLIFGILCTEWYIRRGKNIQP